MEWLVLAAGAVLVVALALFMETGRTGDLGGDAHALALLGRMRSPSGKRFYPTDEAALELSAELEELEGTPGPG